MNGVLSIMTEKIEGKSALELRAKIIEQAISIEQKLDNIIATFFIREGFKPNFYFDVLQSGEFTVRFKLKIIYKFFKFDENGSAKFKKVEKIFEIRNRAAHALPVKIGKKDNNTNIQKIQINPTSPQDSVLFYERKKNSRHIRIAMLSDMLKRVEEFVPEVGLFLDGLLIKVKEKTAAAKTLNEELCDMTGIVEKIENYP